MTFNIGDRVKIVSAYYSAVTSHHDGEIGVITEIDRFDDNQPYLVRLDGDNEVWASRIAAVESYTLTKTEIAQWVTEKMNTPTTQNEAPGVLSILSQLKKDFDLPEVKPKRFKVRAVIEFEVNEAGASNCGGFDTADDYAVSLTHEKARSLTLTAVIAQTVNEETTE